MSENNPHRASYEVDPELAADYSDLPTEASRRFASLIDSTLRTAHEANAVPNSPGIARSAHFILDPNLATTMNAEIWGSRSQASTGYIHANYLALPSKPAEAKHCSWSAEVRVDTEGTARGVYCNVGYSRSTGSSIATVKLLQEREPDNYVDSELRKIFRSVAVDELTRATIRAEIDNDDEVRAAVAEWSELTKPQLLAETSARELLDDDVNQLAHYLSQARWPTVQ